MSASKKFYWIKLKTSFLTSEKVDYLMSQPEGANYVVLYQMLCLLAVNTNGELATSINEIIIPFDEKKIQRDTKWFSIDTIRCALALYSQLGLIYRQENGILKISDYNELVGSETKWADIKRKQRLGQGNGQANGLELDNVQQEYRYIENREKRIDNRELELLKKDVLYKDIKKLYNFNTTNRDIVIAEQFRLWNTLFHEFEDCKVPDDIYNFFNLKNEAFGFDRVVDAMLNYATVLKDNSYYFNYTWKLKDFLQKENALPAFLSNGEKWIQYQGTQAPRVEMKNDSPLKNLMEQIQ